MIVIPRIAINTLSRESLTVSWVYENTTEDMSLYTVTVLRSGSASGPYTSVSDPMLASTTYQYIDLGVNLYSKNRDYFYRIKAINTSTGDSIEYGSAPVAEVMAGRNALGAFLGAPPDLEGLEAIRRNDVLLRNYIGRRVLFLHRRIAGTRCSNCWDHIKRRRTRSDCLTCYGTGVTGGYYYPQETFAAKAPEAIISMITTVFELQPRDLVMIFSSFPRVYPRDLVVTDDRRFRVLNVQRAEKLWSVTHQTVQIRELSKDQVEYSINLTAWDKNTLTASPPKQFINASDISSYYAAVERLGVEND